MALGLDPWKVTVFDDLRPKSVIFDRTPAWSSIWDTGGGRWVSRMFIPLALLFFMLRFLIYETHGSQSPLSALSLVFGFVNQVRMQLDFFSSSETTSGGRSWGDKIVMAGVSLRRWRNNGWFIVYKQRGPSR
jgi:hypothetical protein